MLEGEGCDVGLRHQECKLVVVVDRRKKSNLWSQDTGSNNSGVGE